VLSESRPYIQVGVKSSSNPTGLAVAYSKCRQKGGRNSIAASLCVKYCYFNQHERSFDTHWQKQLQNKDGSLLFACLPATVNTNAPKLAI